MAQAYPAKPVRLVLGFAPGGSTDVVARLLARKLTEKSGQSFVVENRTASGVLEKMDIPGVPEMALAGALFGAQFLPRNRRPPPRPGEHTQEVLQSLGYSAQDIQGLRDAGAVK